MTNWFKPLNQDFPYIQALDPPAQSCSFNLEEYFDEDEIKSSTASSAESLLEETRNWLKDILPVFEKNIVDLVQDTKSLQRVFLAIQGDPSPALSKVLSYLPIVEDQALKVKTI